METMDELVNGMTSTLAISDAEAFEAYGMGRSTSAQNPPRVPRNQITGVVRPCLNDIQECPDVGTSMTVDFASEVSPVQQNTKKRRVMVTPNEDGKVEPSVANIMTGFHDVPVIDAYSFGGGGRGGNGGEDVPIAPWKENSVIWEAKLILLIHMGLHPQKETVQKGEVGVS
ncbi:hypothetical protein ACE6H2_019245 [Prunus campanulata]